MADKSPTNCLLASACLKRNWNPPLDVSAAPEKGKDPCGRCTVISVSRRRLAFSLSIVFLWWRLTFQVGSIMMKVKGDVCFLLAFLKHIPQKTYGMPMPTLEG
jgi:hypothetical protein